MQECAHFHYEVNTVEIPHNFSVSMMPVEVANDHLAPADFKPNCSHDEPPSSNGLSNTATTASIWFQLQVTAQEKRWIIYRTHENFCYLDKFLHECIFDRKFSCLDELKSLSECSVLGVDSAMTSSVTSISSNVTFLPSTLTKKGGKKGHQAVVDQNPEQTKQVRKALAAYLDRFCEIVFVNPINCGPILNWFEVIALFFNNSLKEYV
jgi:hypothetical protein